MKVWRPLGNKPLPKLPFSFPSAPIPATPGNFNTIWLNISSAVIKFWVWQNYQIIQNNLPKLGTWILDLWNPHIMKFELIGSRNLHNKIKGNASRQRAVHLVTYNYYNYCFYRTGAAALPCWWYCYSPVNKPPHSPLPHTQPRYPCTVARHLTDRPCKCDSGISKRKNKNPFSICIFNTFLELLLWWFIA